MPLTSWLYERICRRPAPYWLKQNSLLRLVWKVIRKYLNVVIIPTIPSNIMRIWGYRLVGYKIGKRVFIGMDCYLDDLVAENITIEDNVTVSYRVTFACHGPSMKIRGVTLRTGCYIGACATILGGADVGRYATIGACSLVNKPVPDFAVVVGVPARVIATDRVPHPNNSDAKQALAEHLA